jgi:peptide-methionine (S)-S-oxide reductase
MVTRISALVALAASLPLRVVAFATVGPSHRPASFHLQAVRESTFGMGCFWEPSEELLKVDGVLDTMAGYTGNPRATKAPSYDSVCYGREWVESVRVVWDDEKLSYTQLLNAFFEKQKPQLGSRQYASIIFHHDIEQEKTARRWILENVNKPRQDGRTTQMTSIEPTSKFFLAEGYHQKFWQKQRPRFAGIIGLLAIASGIMDPITPENYQSTAATGANLAVLMALAAIVLERKIDANVVEL